MRTLLLSSLFILSACVTHRSVTLPSGVEGYAIECPGTARDISYCMNEAAKVCGGAYRILDHESATTGLFVSPWGVTRGVTRTLIVSCR